MRGDSPMQGGSQSNAQALARGVQHVVVRTAGRSVQITVDATGEVYRLAILADHHASRRVALEDDAFQALRHMALFPNGNGLAPGLPEAAGVGQRKMNRHPRDGFLSLEELELLVHGLEQLPMRADTF